ncbi:MAG: YczE/YyaS/YitT family protein [Acidimicrobiia bacterium]
MSKYLTPVAGERLPRRVTQLVVGLVLFGFGVGLMLQSGLGVPPWDVLHQGLARQFGLTVGVWSIIISVIVLLLWLPLRQAYGMGTLLNAVIIGVVIDLTGVFLPEAESTVVAWVMLIGGVVLIGIASGLYIGANLGPGPRDGLMTGIAKRGPSIRLTRGVIEITVLVLGWILGGTFGIGTIVFALAIGPLVQYFLPRWDISPHPMTDPLDHSAR